MMKENLLKPNSQGIPPSTNSIDNQQKSAYWITGIILLCGILTKNIDILLKGNLSSFSLFIFHVFYPAYDLAKIFQIPLSILDFVLAIGLFQVNKTVRVVTIARAFLGAIIVSLQVYKGMGIFSLVPILYQWGFSGAVILLLTGKSSIWRSLTALTILVAFTIVLRAFS